MIYGEEAKNQLLRRFFGTEMSLVPGSSAALILRISLGNFLVPWTQKKNLWFVICHLLCGLH